MSGRREALRRSTRPSIMREVNLTALSEAFNIPLGVGSDSDESSDQEYTPNRAASSDEVSTNDSGSDGSGENQEVDDDDDDDDENEEEEEEEEEEEGVEKREGKGDIDGGLCMGKHIHDCEDEMQAVSPITTATSTSPPPPSIPPLSATTCMPLCCVCMEKAKHNDIVTCDMCGVSVHEGCYGVPEEEDSPLDGHSDISSHTTAPWFCDACKAGVKDPCCELCPNDGGIFKQTTNGRWVHMVCMLYISSVEYVDPRTLSGVSLDQLPSSYWGARSCQLCSDDWLSRTGVCINCDAGLCKTYFHATCAQREGLLCEADDDSEDSKEEIADAYFAHCTAHCDKQVAKRKRKDYLKIQRGTKKFKFDTSDERLLSHLRQSRKAYQTHFAELQQRYQPMATLQKRMLHHNPPALKLLTQKAQLLGFVALPFVPKVKRHGGRVPVSLTCEFVNYFHERNDTLEQLRKRKEMLTNTKDSLTQQKTTLDTKHHQLQKEYSSLQSASSQLQDKQTLLSRTLTKITGEEVISTRTEVHNHTNATEPSSGNDQCCCVCDETTSSHLMVSCDTCNNFYHIFCLDPPLSRVPKKSRKFGWQCENCCCDSDEDLKPTVAENEPHSRSGRPLRSNRNFYLEELQLHGSIGSYH